MLSQPYRDVWWQPNDDARKTLLSLVTTALFPFFEELKSVEEVANFLAERPSAYRYVDPQSKSRSLEYAALAYRAIGNEQKAAFYLEKAESEAELPSAAVDIAALRKRLNL